MINKVLFLNPSCTLDKGCIRRLVYPIRYLYIASLLEKNGYNVKILDSPCEGYENTIYHDDYVTYGLSDEQIKERLKKEKPDVVGISCSFSSNEKKVYHLSKLVKEVDKNIIIITGGIHPSLFPEKMLSECPPIDFIVMKEGEYRTLNLLNALNNNESYENQDGIAFRKNGKIKVNPAIEIIKNLDSLPFPNLDLIDLEKYFRINKPANPFPRKRRVATVLTSRGCPYSCCFCAGTAYWGRFRTRSVDNVIEEMRILKEKYKIEEIHFCDDNITVDGKRALELFKRMKEFNFKWCTPSGIMMSSLNRELIKAMAESGCYQLTFSPESGSQRVLDEIIHKPLKLEIVRPLVDICHEYDIDIHSNFIMGLPGETKEEFMRSFEFAKEADFDSAAFFIAVPYAGTELYNICKSRGWLKKDYDTGDFKHANILMGEHEKEFIMPKEEMVRLVDLKTNEFNEWSKKRHPERWERKFKLFLALQKEDEDSKKIMGRVV